VESALILALSPAVTSAYLFQQVQGRHRFVARGDVPNLPRPQSSVADSAVAAATEVERITGRPLFARGEPITPVAPDGSGVGMIGCVCRPGGALRVAVVGEDAGLAYDSATRVVSGSGQDLVFAASLDDRELQRTEGLYAAVQRLREARPDVIFLAFYSGPQSSERLERIGLALGAVDIVPGYEPPVLLYAGSESLLGRLRDSVGARSSIKSAAALRPASGMENLEPAKAALVALHCEIWTSLLPDFDYLASWLAGPPVPQDVALRNMVRFLHETSGEGVWALDFDRASPGLFVAGPDGFSSFRFRPSPSSLEQAAAWLGPCPDADDLKRIAANLTLRPTALWGDELDAACEGALMRGLFRMALDDPRVSVTVPALNPRMTQVIGTGPGTGAVRNAAEAAMLLLDCCQVAGIGSLRWDALSLMAPAGALAEMNPGMASEVAVADASRPLAVYIAPFGLSQSGSAATQVRAQYEDDAAVRMEVPFGAVESLPVPRGSKATISVDPVGRLDVGAGAGRGVQFVVDGAPLGVVVDARGRPFVPSPDPTGRAKAAADSLEALDCRSVERSVR
jgi:hypothetical protein